MNAFDVVCLWIGRLTLWLAVAWCVGQVRQVLKDTLRDVHTAWQIFLEDGRGVLGCILWTAPVFFVQLACQIKAYRGGYSTRLTKMKMEKAPCPPTP